MRARLKMWPRFVSLFHSPRAAPSSCQMGSAAPQLGRSIGGKLIFRPCMKRLLLVVLSHFCVSLTFVCDALFIPRAEEAICRPCSCLGVGINSYLLLTWTNHITGSTDMIALLLDRQVQ